MQYPNIIKILHWLMAITIIGLIASGIYMEDLPLKDEGKYLLYPWHKSFGVLILILVFIRLFLRIIMRKKIPSLPKMLQKSEKILAKIAHILLYLFMFAVPISGFIMSMAGGYGVKFFGLAIPNFIGKNKELADIADEIHAILPYIMFVIIIFHILGALKHRFFDKENNVLPFMGIKF